MRPILSMIVFAALIGAGLAHGAEEARLGSKPPERPINAKAAPLNIAFISYANPQQVQRDLEKPKQRYRIFVFGGSTSLGSRSQATVAAYLEQALNRDEPGRYECIMAGMSGWSSINELMLVASKVMYLQPDMLLTFFITSSLAINRVIITFSVT